MDCDVLYEELAAFARDELEAPREEEVRRHLGGCGRCRKRLAALRQADDVLAALPPAAPPARAVLAARRALSQATRGPSTPDILTLEEAAEFLRITPEQLGQIVDELPAFELAGQVRIRREKLDEWIQHRERDHARRAAASWAARDTAGTARKGALS